MTTTRRISQAIAGMALAVFGAGGIAATWSPATVSAQTAPSDPHEDMQSMMEHCSAMMDTMEGMSSMMNGNGMRNMMNGQGMTNMMGG